MMMIMMMLYNHSLLSRFLLTLSMGSSSRWPAGKTTQENDHNHNEITMMIIIMVMIMITMMIMIMWIFITIIFNFIPEVTVRTDFNFTWTKPSTRR